MAGGSIREDSPLKCEIEEYEENAKAVSGSVGCTSIQSCHGRQARHRHELTHEAYHVHGSPRVDFIVKPSSARIIDRSCSNISRVKENLDSRGFELRKTEAYQQ